MCMKNAAQLRIPAWKTPSLQGPAQDATVHHSTEKISDLEFPIQRRGPNSKENIYRLELQHRPLVQKAFLPSAVPD